MTAGELWIAVSPSDVTGRSFRPMHQRRKRQSETRRRDDRPRTYSVNAVTGTFHLRWLEYIKKRRDSSIGGLRMA